MSHKISSHIRSNVVGYVALFFAFTGGAYALSIAPKNSVISKSIKNGQVKTKDLANGAVTNPKLATDAVISANVLDNSLTGNDVDESTLGQVPSAAQADSADTAAHADSATNATHAGNSDQLGGSAASAFQSRVTGTCPNHGAVSSINSNGTVGCDSAVLPIYAQPQAGTASYPLYVSGALYITVFCHANGGADKTSVQIQNISGGSATLNWLESDGTTVSANGIALGPSYYQEFQFGGKRLEGQFIFSEANDLFTVNLHAFDGGSVCDARGTAEYAHT